MPSRRTPSSSRSTAVTQPPVRPCSRSSSRRRPAARPARSGGAPSSIRARVPGLRRAAAPTRRAASASRAAARWAIASSSASTSAGVAVAPGRHQLGPGARDARTGHVGAGGEREPERAAGQAGERERLGQHVRQADHPGDRGVLLGGRRRHRPGAEVADELGQPQPGLERRCPSSSVSAHGASRNSSGSAAAQPVSSTPASGWPPTKRAPRQRARGPRRAPAA